MYMLLISLFVSSGLCFSGVKIEPEAEFHEKGKSLIIKCDATSIFKKPILMYSYQHSNYSLHRVQYSNKYVYVGNLTLTTPKQFKVNIFCINSENNEFLNSKIYFFGYPPSILLQDNSKPVLNCQDFSLERIICCYKPTENELAKKMGIVEEHDGNLTISLYNMQSDPDSSQFKFNNSCFNITPMPITPSVQFSLIISNLLGRQAFEFSFKRTEILKPEIPVIYLRPNGNNSIIIVVQLHDVSEFFINYTCSSTIHPISQTGEIGNVTKKETKIKSDGWKPNSDISCSVQSRICLGHETVGNFSEVAFSRIRMPEGIPNSGPLLSPALMNYQFTKSNYLENVSIYFPDLPLTEQNGKIIKYEWHCDNCFFKSKNVSNSTHKISGNIRNIKLDKSRLSSLLYLAACTTIGCSYSKVEFQVLAETRPQNRVLLVRDSGNEKQMNFIWYLNNETSPIVKPTLVYCYQAEDNLESPDNECKSIQMVDLTRSLVGRKSFLIDDTSKAKFALISSLKGSNISKIQWHDCIYKDVTNSEVDKRLKELKIDEFIKFEVKCGWYNCTVHVRINLPSCQDLPVVAIAGILISYDSGNGRKNATNLELWNTSFELQLTDLNLGTKYQSNISIIDYKNEIIFWISRMHYTNWLSPTYLTLIMLGTGGLLIIVIIYIVWKYKSVKKRIFKTNNVKNKHVINIGPTHKNFVKTINLNNVENHTYNFRNGTPYEYVDTSGSPERTYSTNVTNSSNHSYESNPDQLTDSNDLDSYVSRPDLLPTSIQKNPDNKEVHAIYMYLVDSVSKESNENINPFRFNEEDLGV